MEARTCMRTILATALLVVVTVAQADYLQASRHATVKENPDRNARILFRVDRGERLRLISNQQTDSYYRVELPDGSGEGWISRYLVRRYVGEIPGVLDSDSGLLEVHVLDVGQADAVLIRCPDGQHEMLIDAGDTRYKGSSKKFKAYLRARQSTDNEIEVVIATHPHADHIGNMAWVLDTYRVGLYVDNGNEYNSATYRRLEDAYARHNPSYWSAQDDLVPEVDFCPRSDVSAVVLRPDGFGESSDPNDNSIIVRVDYGEDSFLFVGDCEAEEEHLLIEDGETSDLLDCDFLKVGHHGSHTSSTRAFLDLITPQIAVISCGAKGISTNKRYKHPRQETIATLFSFVDPRDGSPVTIDAFDSDSSQWERVRLDRAIYLTTADGSLVFESDGEGIRKRR